MSVQIRWNTIVTFMISLLEVVVFALAFFSNNYEYLFKEDTPEFLNQLKFYCMEDTYTRWETEVTFLAEMLFTMHIIIIFMYSTINLMVLSSVPYKHNRFKKTEEEKAKEVEKKLKRLAKKSK